MDLLKQTHRGPAVILLQRALTRAGMLEGAADGIFGPKTFKAVQTFQRVAGLTPDGIAGPRTWRALKPALDRTKRYRLKSGDRPSTVAAQYSITTKELLAANPDAAFISGETLVVPDAGSAVSADIDYSYSVILADISALRVRYPFLGYGTVGKSVRNRDIPVLRFGRGPVRVIYNASHHANEYITSAVLMRFAEELSNAAVNARQFFKMDARRLRSTVSLFLIPMVNPDGVDLVTGALQANTESYRYAESIKGDAPFPAGWKANIRGVDLNNNYPALFEEGYEAKTELGINFPGPRDYTGQKALSEPETSAMAKLTREISPRMTISLHTQGREIYYRFNGITPPNARRIGEAMAASASGYTLADPPGPSYGGYKDWFIQDFRKPGFTLELGSGQNPLPMSAFESIYMETAPMLAAAISGLI